MMKKRVILVYDCPKEKCDKLWVYHALEKNGYDVKIVDWPFRISHLEQRGRIGVLLAVFVVMIQSLYAVMISKPDDIMFCWMQKSGIYCNCFARGKRKIISYNWLTPRPKKRTQKLYAAALENPQFRAVINALENKEKNLQAYRAKDMGNMYYIPDVYEENVTFQKPQYHKENFPETVYGQASAYRGRYCFMGGRANRDWKLFIEAANKCPDILFVGVAAACDWDKNMKIPKNVLMYFDISAEAYYDLMCHAYLAVYPLEQQRVSGLINIIKGTMDGIPVLITELPVTAMYYGEQSKSMLFQMGDCDSMCDAIKRAYGWSEGEYVNMVTKMQHHIKENFSPEMAGEKINEIIKSFS